MSVENSVSEVKCTSQILKSGLASVLIASTAVGVAIFGTGAAPIAHAAQDSSSQAEPRTQGGPTTFRRLTETQYKRTIEDVFGAGIKVGGRFEPPLRAEGLLAIGDGKVSVSPSGFEQYELRAREIAGQVLAEDRRKAVLSCTPNSVEAVDKPCAAEFLGKYGRLLFRRPLSAQELSSVTGLTSEATVKTRNFYKGLEAGLARLLASPSFIFRMERSIPDPAAPGVLRLDDYSLASRVSFLLWDAPPDPTLLDAAASGALRTSEGLAQQVDRLIASPRFEQGVRAFFSDMFAYEQFDGLSKDQTIYPKFTSQVAKDAQEQMLLTIVDLLVTKKGDYRDLFTTRQTFLNRNLASLYRVPISVAGVEGWTPYTFQPQSQRAGIFTLAGFLMLDPTHEGRSSPTIRGKSVRELFLCQPVPLPPPNVDFSAVQNTGDQVHKTARARLTIHQDNPVCAGCHAITDPIGLAMEHYDAIGNFRTHENGALIDASGSFEGRPYKDAISLQQLLRDSPSSPNCVVQRAFEYGVGRPLAEGEDPWVEFAARSFAADRYEFPALMRRIATSRAFQAISASKLASVE